MKTTLFPLAPILKCPSIGCLIFVHSKYIDPAKNSSWFPRTITHLGFLATLLYYESLRGRCIWNVNIGASFKPPSKGFRLRNRILESERGRTRELQNSLKVSKLVFSRKLGEYVLKHNITVFLNLGDIYYILPSQVCDCFTFQYELVTVYGIENGLGANKSLMEFLPPHSGSELPTQKKFSLWLSRKAFD